MHLDHEPLVVLVVELEDDRALRIVDVVEHGAVALIKRPGGQNPRNPDLTNGV